MHIYTYVYVYIYMYVYVYVYIYIYIHCIAGAESMHGAFPPSTPNNFGSLQDCCHPTNTVEINYQENKRVMKTPKLNPVAFPPVSQQQFWSLQYCCHPTPTPWSC